MGLFNRLFGKRKQNRDNGNQNINEKRKEKSNRTSSNTKSTGGPSFTISSGKKMGVSFSSDPVGDLTDSDKKDFYVYEWFIKDTGEVFYVGKGRGDRYKRYHDRAYEAEKIREMYDTDLRFVGTGLTEEQAVELESEEMIRILNETNDRLTNRITPLFTKRDNGYNRSPNTPKLEFEKAPTLYASEIEEHYFDVKHRPFDKVIDENLKSVVFITRNMRDEIDIIYGGDYEQYIDETKNLLVMNNSRILKTQYAKSVTAWIFIGDDYVSNYRLNQEKAIEELGRNIPTFHLLDVRKFLLNKYGEPNTPSKEDIIINPIHKRVPLKEIKNLDNWEKGYDEGMPYWEEGDKERKNGNIEKAIKLFDNARYNGYDAPALYRSYAMAYRRLKDYDNEIAILDELIERSAAQGNSISIELKERRERSLELKKKRDF